MRMTVTAIAQVARGYYIRADAHLYDDRIVLEISDPAAGTRLAHEEFPITSVKASSLTAAATVIGFLSQSGETYGDDGEAEHAYRIVSLAREIEKESERKP